MTPDPSSSLVERVAAAIYQANQLHPASEGYDMPTWERLDGWIKPVYRDMALAAIRVVVECAAEIALTVVPDSDVIAVSTKQATTTIYTRPLSRFEIADRIRALLPEDTP